MPGTRKSGGGHSKSEVVKPAVFPIVGNVASAGGLAAFEAFFSGMPADRDPEMAFVLVQLSAARVRCTHGPS